MTNAAEDKPLIIKSKRHRKKTASEMIAELSFSRQQPVLFSTVKNQLRSAGLSGCIAIKKSLLHKVNKQKRLMGKKKSKS